MSFDKEQIRKLLVENGCRLDNDSAVSRTVDLLATHTAKRCEEYKKEMFDTAYNTFKIMGKSVDEICVILSALELERITGIKVTMGNLNKLSKIVTEDLRESFQKAITKSFDQVLLINKEEQ